MTHTALYAEVHPSNAATSIPSAASQEEMANMNPGGQSPSDDKKAASHNSRLEEITTGDAIGAHDEDIVIVGADGLQLFESETSEESIDSGTPQERLPMLKLCLPVISGGCEVVSVILDLDDPEAEVNLFRTVFIPAYRTRDPPDTTEQLEADIWAFHTACGYILRATSEHAAMRTVITAGKKMLCSAKLIAWMHCNIVHRHQARVLVATRAVRESLPELRAVMSATYQILRGCEIARPGKKSAHHDDLHDDEASKSMEISSMKLKGHDQDNGAGTVQMRWTGAAPATGDPSIHICEVDNQLHLALITIDFGDVVMGVTIEANLKPIFEQRLPGLLRTSMRDGPISAVIMQSLYQAIILHCKASQKLNYCGCPKDYINEVVYDMLNEWYLRYWSHQGSAELAEHAIFFDAVFQLAANIDIHIRHDGTVNYLEARGGRG